MKMNLSFLRVLLVAFLVLVLSGQGFAAGYVLCLGEDGHLAVERSYGKECATAAPQPCEMGLSDHAHDVPHCGDCQDRPLAFQDLHGSSRIDEGFLDHATLDLFMAPSASWVSTPYGRDLTPRLLSQPPPRRSVALQSLRTIVLLI